MSQPIAIVGGGPAGIMAALVAVRLGKEVHLFEQNSELGKKLLITGGGRCNLTTAVSEPTFLSRLIGEARFVRPALSALSQSAVMELFENLGVRLKREGDKIYPRSNSALEVRDALENELRALGVHIHLNQKVKQINIDHNHIVGLTTTKQLHFKRLIVTTGGMSFTKTGSDGRLLASLTQVDQEPWHAGLVPFITSNDFSSIMGVQVADAVLSYGKQQVRGEVLCTHRGLSGPAVLDLSSYLAKEQLPVWITIDWLPETSAEELSQRLFGPKKGLDSRLSGLLPKRLLQYVLEPVRELDLGNLPKAKRNELLARFKAHPVQVKALGSLEQAIVSLGGVSLKQVNPKTMEHRVVKGLYFAGECLAISGPTGGYNLQIAFSTGYLAGRNA